jgi:hypothetical protein
MKNGLEKVRQECIRGGIRSSVILAEMLEGVEKENALKFLLAAFIEHSAGIKYSNEINGILKSLDCSLSKKKKKKLFDVRFTSSNNNVYELIDLIEKLPENERAVYYEKLLPSSLKTGVKAPTLISILANRPLNDQEKGTIIKYSLDEKCYLDIPGMLSDLGLKQFGIKKWRRLFKKELADKNYYRARDITTLIDNAETKKLLLGELWRLTKDGVDQKICTLIASDLGIDWNEEASLKIFRQFLSNADYDGASLFAHQHLSSRKHTLRLEIFETAMKNGNYYAAKEYKPDVSSLTKKQLEELLNNAIDKDGRRSVNDISHAITFYN